MGTAGLGCLGLFWLRHCIRKPAHFEEEQCWAYPSPKHVIHPPPYSINTLHVQPPPYSINTLPQPPPGLTPMLCQHSVLQLPGKGSWDAHQSSPRLSEVSTCPSSHRSSTNSESSSGFHHNSIDSRGHQHLGQGQISTLPLATGTGH